MLPAWFKSDQNVGCRQVNGRPAGNSEYEHDVVRASLRPPMERVTGIEPALSAWEAEVLPLNYTRMRP